MKKCIGIAIVLCIWLSAIVFSQRGRYDFSDPTTSTGNWIPDANNVYDLGSSDYRWKDVYVGPGSVHIGSFTLQQDAIDNDGLEITGSLHSTAVGGIAGNLCIHDGNEPAQSNSPTGSRIWSDPNGVLQHQKSSDAGGGSKQVIVDDGAGNVGIGTTNPKRQFDFDGADVRTQRYLDSDLNTNLGYETFGAENLSGTHNSAFGRHSLYSITSGSGNSGLGNENLYSVTTGSNNVGVGSMSGKGIVGGSHNISLGYKSGYVIANGDNNINIGSYSNYVGTGSKNIIIGYNIDLPIDAGNNQLNIGNLIYGTGLDGVDKVVSTGKIGIGTATPSEKLDVAGNVKISGDLVILEGKNITDGTNNRISIQSGNTSIYGDGDNFLRIIGSTNIRSRGDFGGNADNTYSLGWSGVRWTEVWATNGTIQTSDLREKNANYDFEYGLDKVLNLSPISFTWKTGKDTSTHLGLGAQDVQKVIPEIVRGEDRLALNYMELIPVFN